MFIGHWYFQNAYGALPDVEIEQDHSFHYCQGLQNARQSEVYIIELSNKWGVKSLKTENYEIASKGFENTNFVVCISRRRDYLTAVPFLIKLGRKKYESSLSVR